MPAASCILDFVSMASEQGFPVLIAESLPRYVAGVTAANAWSTWFEPFFNTLLAEPAVKGFSYINRDCGTDPKAKQKCVGGQWGNARIEGPSLKTTAPHYVDALKAARFVHACALDCVEDALGL